jgi:hypothetical protein
MWSDPSSCLHRRGVAATTNVLLSSWETTYVTLALEEAASTPFAASLVDVDCPRHLPALPPARLAGKLATWPAF